MSRVMVVRTGLVRRAEVVVRVAKMVARASLVNLVAGMVGYSLVYNMVMYAFVFVECGIWNDERRMISNKCVRNL